MTSEIRNNNLSNAIFEGNWNAVPNYLNEIHEVDEFGGTALHTAYFYHNTTPFDIFRMLLNAHPGAAKIQNSLGFTPLHYSRRNFSDECTMLLLNVAPEATRMQNYTTGCTPLHYALVDCRSYTIIEAMLQVSPCALDVPNFLGQTPLDWFFRHWYEPIQRLLLNCIKIEDDTSPGQILTMEIVSTKRHRITVRYVYHIMFLLFRQKMINNNKSNPSSLPIILYAALYLNYCPWLFCRLLSHIHPEQIFKTTAASNSTSILLQTSNDGVPLKSCIYDRIYKCTRCGSSTIDLFVRVRGFFCRECITYKKIGVAAKVVLLHREEELERLQYIYFLLRGDPSLCAINNWE